MPNELDFMKTREEKGMPEEEFKTVRDDYNKKADAMSELIKKIIMILLGALTVSTVAVNLFCLTVESLQFGLETPQPIFIWLVIFIILIALFLYDPKAEDDKRYRYETDQKIILKSLESKIKINKIRFGGVIAMGVIAAAANLVCWWFVFSNISSS